MDLVKLFLLLIRAQELSSTSNRLTLERTAGRIDRTDHMAMDIGLNDLSRFATITSYFSFNNSANTRSSDCCSTVIDWGEAFKVFIRTLLHHGASMNGITGGTSYDSLLFSKSCTDVPRLIISSQANRSLVKPMMIDLLLFSLLLRSHPGVV